MENELVKQRVYILQSENDDRLYRGLHLANGMKALLISDPTAEKSAAAIDVRVGSAADPPRIPGLARLLQRVIYLTCETTQNRLFKNYVLNNDGTANAKTHLRSSSYYFEINSNNLQDALPCFSKFFVQPPVFAKDVIKNEMSNVIRELETNKFDDDWKKTEFIKWIRRHYESLPEPETKKLIKTVKPQKMKFANILEIFYGDFYLAENMKLCVLGKESLDDLEELVVNHFSPMTAIVKSPFCVGYKPMSPCSSVYKISYVPHEDYNRLDVIFDLQLCLLYQSCAIEYFLAYLFKYEGRGSLLSDLKARGWGNSIEAGPLRESYPTETYVVSVDLTEEGVEHVDGIMELYFQYVNMLQENNEFRRIYNEYKEIQELNFRFKEKESPLTYVTRLSRVMYQSQLKHVLRGINMPIKWKPKSVQTVLEGFISPLRMSVYVGSKKFKTVTDSIALYYNYKYKIDEVPVKTCARWLKISCPTTLDLPPCNEFIPTSITVKPQEIKTEKFPTIIKNSSLLKLWHKKDDKFNVPRATMMFHFLSPVTYKDPANANFTLMFIWLINNYLSEYVHPASLAGLHWELGPTSKGIQLKISGFNNKQYLLLEKILDRMVNFELSKKNFEVFRQKNIKISLMELQKFQSDLPFSQAQYYLSLLLMDKMCDKEDILKACYKVNFDRFHNFVSLFFDSIYVEGLIHGNVTSAEALDIARLIENKVTYASLLPVEKMYRDIRLKDETHFILHKENRFRLNSCTLVYYQIERRTTKWDVLLDFLAKIIKTPCKRLGENGNIAHAGVYRSNGMQGLTISVQEQNSCMHKQIEKNIDTFMHSVVDYIAKMSEQHFEAIKKLFIETRRADEPKTLNELSDAFWNEIVKREYNFDRTNVEIDVLNEITLHDILCFFKELVNEKTPKVSIYVTTGKNIFSSKDKSVFISRNYIVKIEDINSFRNSQELCSMPHTLNMSNDKKLLFQSYMFHY